jgi:hypothetical protein
MRITRDLLHKLARENAEKIVRRNRGLICIYLTGSLLEEEPLLGGTTDIDLIIIHNSQPAYPREMVRLSDEVHLDIANLPVNDFSQPRNLRSDPWLGTFLCANPIVLHDTQHWFEFTQASAGAQFDQPENVVLRARKLAAAARQIWVELFDEKSLDHPRQLLSYLSAIEQAANAIATLSGTPLTERRFLLHFPQRAEAAGRSALAADLIDLIVPPDFDPQEIAAWLPAWKESLAAASQSEGVQPRLLPPRLPYYSRAAEALIDDAPYPALWLVLRTWTQAAMTLPAGAEAAHPWQAACKQLLLDKEHFDRRYTALDAFLDSVEEIVDTYAARYGV